MPVPKRKTVLPHMLQPTQFLVHEDIVAEKIDDILAGETPHVVGQMMDSGRINVADGHHAAAAYEALGRRVPVSYSTEKVEDWGDYDWEDVHTVSDEHPDVEHPKAGPQSWHY